MYTNGTHSREGKDTQSQTSVQNYVTNKSTNIPSIQLENKVLCIDHAAARAVCKLVELRLDSIVKLKVSVKQQSDGLAVMEESLSNCTLLI